MKKNDWIVIGLIVSIFVGLVSAWLYTNREGYALSIVKERVTTEFKLLPEWIPEKSGDETELNIDIEEVGVDQIVLEKVGKRDNDFYIQLNVKPNV